MHDLPRGGVESRGKAIRLQHLTPIPQGESLAAIAQVLEAEFDRAFVAKVDAEGVWQGNTSPYTVAEKVRRGWSVRV